MKRKSLPHRLVFHSFKGQSLVEFAMAATVMLFLLLATMDFGLAFFSWIALRDAAQEGATYGSLHPPISTADSDSDTTAIKTRVKTATTTPVNFASLSNTAITVEVLDNAGNPGGTPCPGNGIRVTVTYNYNVITPMVSSFIGRSYIPISAVVADTILQGNSALTPACPN